MSGSQKQKCSKRNFELEAELQIKILQQKAREDFLINFSEFENTTAQTVETPTELQRSESDTKAYIPTKAKSVLEKWMYDHRLYCYPTKAEKQALATETGLSIQKISNWFINSRRRMLPKMLETEGKDPVNFTISRKKKKCAAAAAAAVTSAEGSNAMTNCFLGNYAVAEESKIIDQNSIFYGTEIEMDESHGSNVNYNRMLQEIIVPYTEIDDEVSRMSQLTIKDEQFQPENDVNHVTRGILYDPSTQSKCLFILVSSSK